MASETDKSDNAEIAWRSPDYFRRKPPQPGYESGSETGYGFLTHSEASACSLEELQYQIWDDENNRPGALPLSMLVWAPEHPRLVLPEEVAALHGSVRKRIRHTGFETLKQGMINTGMCVAAGGFFFGYYMKKPTFFMLIIFFMFMYHALQKLIGGLLTVIVYSGSGDKMLISRANTIRFELWAARNSRKAVVAGIMVAILALIYLLQWKIGLNKSLNAGAVVRSDVLNKEYWRLLTGTMMHGFSLHILFNGMFFWSIGKRITSVGSWTHIPVVFMVAAVTGSTAFILFSSGNASVGASGGLMGLVGYMLVMGFTHYKALPKKFLWPVIEILVVIGAMGWFGKDYIDNYGHFGGLLGGIVVSVPLLIFHRNRIPFKPGIPGIIAAIFSGAAFLASAGYTAYVLLNA